MNNVVIVSGGKQRDSAIHMNVSVLPQIPLPSRPPHNIEQDSLCYTVGPCWLSELPNYSYPPPLILLSLYSAFHVFLE